MEIRAEQLAKRFKRQWIFRNFSISIGDKGAYAVTGPNGSGKSTLLRVLAGTLPPSEGRVEYISDGRQLKDSEIYRQIAFAAPYIDLIDEMTVAEHFRFHRSFRPFKDGLDVGALVDLLGKRFHRDTMLNAMSSGMKQRMRLALALCSESQLLILDEPTTNLDEQGKEWYHMMLSRFRGNATLLIASNVADDMAVCESTIHVPDYASSK